MNYLEKIYNENKVQDLIEFLKEYVDSRLEYSIRFCADHEDYALLTIKKDGSTIARIELTSFDCKLIHVIKDEEKFISNLFGMIRLAYLSFLSVNYSEYQNKYLAYMARLTVEVLNNELS